MKKILAALTLIASSALASKAVVAHLPAERLVLVARGDRGTIEARDDRFGMPVWSAEGLNTPRLSAVSSSGSLAAFGDPLNNEVLLISAKSRMPQRYEVSQTPVAMLFLDEVLYVLSRDEPALTRIEGERIQSVVVPPSPTHLAESGKRLLVYSSQEGTLTEFDAALQQTRNTAVSRYGSDLEAEPAHVYLVFPRSGKMSVLSLPELRPVNEFTVGAVPVDLDPGSDGNLLSPGAVSVADPSSKRVWQVDRPQTATEAFGRGFLRGLLGLGLYSAGSSEFPTGIDRVWTAGGKTLAYDSSSSKLYQMVGGKGRLVAETDSALAVAVVGGRLAVWRPERKALEFLTLK